MLRTFILLPIKDITGELSLKKKGGESMEHVREHVVFFQQACVVAMMILTVAVIN